MGILNTSILRFFLLVLSLVSFNSFGVEWLAASSLTQESGTSTELKHGTILSFSSAVIDIPIVADKEITCQRAYSSGCLLGWYLRGADGYIYNVPDSFFNDKNPWLFSGTSNAIELHNGQGTFSFKSLTSSDAYKNAIAKLNKVVRSEFANSLFTSTGIVSGCAFMAVSRGGYISNINRIPPEYLYFPPGMSLNSYCLPIPPLNNKCAFSAGSLNVEFGNLSLKEVSSASVRRKISITCTLDSTIQLSGNSSIPLTNGMQSIVKVNGDDFSTKSFSASGGAPLEIPLDFSLSGTPVVGNFSGSSVLYVNIL